MASGVGGKRVLVLRAYGLIGAACLRRLRHAGHEVTGMGRSERAARAVGPDMSWVLRDLTGISIAEWALILNNIDVVVNAAGALQDGAKDRVEAIHVGMIGRLTRAAMDHDHPIRLIQISAAGVTETASNAFFRTKAKGDALVQGRIADHVILRPTLVLSAEAYGGTALLRAAAALPLVLPVVYPTTRIQTVHVADVADAVCRAVEGRIAPGTIADLTEDQSHSLQDLTGHLRAWLGFPPARITVQVPNWTMRLTGRCADVLGHLGWRPAMRSTALTALRDGITGDPAAWRGAGGPECRALQQTLSDVPATAQDRLSARAYVALPLAIMCLSLFWIMSGAIALARPEPARAILELRGSGSDFSAVAVYGGALLDIALGLAILVRRWCRAAAFGMVVLSLGYLAGSLVWAPDLWADPLGPMVKVLPAAMLAAMVGLLLDTR